MDWGTVPQWIYSGYSRGCGRDCDLVDLLPPQYRTKASIKTEMDEKMIVAYDSFHTGLNEMRKAKSVEEFCTSEASRPHYLAIRKYLNVHELIAVGIRKKVLDHDVCYEYWCDTLTNGYRDAKPVSEYVRNKPKNKYTYSELHSTNTKWLQRMEQEEGMRLALKSAPPIPQDLLLERSLKINSAPSGPAGEPSRLQEDDGEQR
jgi:hypothetical protein